MKKKARSFKEMPATFEYKGHTYHKTERSEGYESHETGREMFKYFFSPDDDRMFLWVDGYLNPEEDLFNYDQDFEALDAEIAHDRLEKNFKTSVEQTFGFDRKRIRVVMVEDLGDGVCGEIEVCGIRYQISLPHHTQPSIAVKGA